MRRVRITIQHNPADPADDLRYAARVRRELWAYSPVEIIPDDPAHQTRRDERRNAYFEFTTNYPEEVNRVIDQYGHRQRVTVALGAIELGAECVRCGYADRDLHSVCPNCGFRDISPCPSCHQEIARQAYLAVDGDLFQCPACLSRVRLQFHEPLFDGQGHYNEPLVVVEGSGG